MNVNEIPVELRKKWVVALRSGEYTQGRGAMVLELRTDQFSFCCLGVLCVVGGIQRKEIEQNALLTNGHLKALGMKGSARGLGNVTFPIAISDGVHYDAVMLNDTLRLTFDQIADLVEYCAPR